MAASRHHGITTNEFTQGVRSISDISTAIIGMVCTADDADREYFPLNTPVFYTSAYDVLGKAGTQGTLAKSLDAIVDQADAQIVIVRVPHNTNVDTLRANIIGTATGNTYTGIKALRRAKAITGFTPKILGVPELDSQSVVTELLGVAQATRAFVYASAGGAANISDVAAYRRNFGQRELMLIDNDFLAFNPLNTSKFNGSTAFNGSQPFQVANQPAATIARVLGARAKLDQQIGWHKSISNTEINDGTEYRVLQGEARGRIIEADPGSDKQGEGGEHKFKIALVYWKETLDGEPVIEIDVMGNKAIFGGKDERASLRRALGMM